MPVMALPRMRPVHKISRVYSSIPRDILAMNIALAFIRLRDEEICNMSTNPVFIADSVAAEDFL